MVSLHGDGGTQARTLDSSEVLRTTNYHGTIREVALMRRQASFNTLDEALKYASRDGFDKSCFSIVNITHSGLGPEGNEPRAVMRDLADAIIMEDQRFGTYSFYRAGQGFTYIP